MDWSVVFLAEADQELNQLGRGGANRTKVEAAVVDQFKGFKGDRIQKLLEAGTSTGAVDRLDASVYPTSIRLQVLQDYRATAWLFPAQRHGFVVSVFAKSQDPDYRKAVAIHDSRLKAYMDSLQLFHDRRKHRLTREGSTNARLEAEASGGNGCSSLPILRESARTVPHRRMEPYEGGRRRKVGLWSSLTNVSKSFLAVSARSRPENAGSSGGTRF